MNKSSIFKILLLICLFFSFNTAAYEDYRSKRVKYLEDSLFKLNNQGEFVQSYELINQFRKTFGNNADDNYYSLLYLSYLHKRLSDYDKVQMYLDSAEIYIPQTSNPEQFKINQKCQKCFAYFDVQAYDVARSIMQEIAPHVESNLANDDLSMYYMQQGYIHFLSKDYAQAEQKLKQSESIMNKHLPVHLPIVYTKLMQLYDELGKDSLMSSNFKKSLAIAEKYGIKKYTVLTYQVRKVIAEKDQNFDEYLQYDILFDRAENDYDANQYQIEIVEIEKKNALEKNALKLKQTNQKNRWLIYFSTLVCLILFIALFFWWKVTKLSTLLKKQHEELSTLDTLNKELFSVISHDLKEPLISIRFFLDKIKNSKTTTSEEIISGLENQVEITSNILHDLLTWSAEELRLNSNEQEKIGLEQIVNTAIGNFAQIIKQKNISIQLKTIAPNNWNLDPWVCSIVIRNLLSNAIKFSEINGEISIMILEDNLEVRDEGVGLKKTLISSNFNTRQTPGYGTSGESGFGIGLYLSQTLLSRSGFYISAHQNSPKGAIFQIHKNK